MNYCKDCDSTKDLKGFWEWQSMTASSICKDCFFKGLYPNYSDVLKVNWDEFDYNWKLKELQGVLT